MMGLSSKHHVDWSVDADEQEYCNLNHSKISSATNVSASNGLAYLGRTTSISALNGSPSEPLLAQTNRH